MDQNTLQTTQTDSRPQHHDTEHIQGGNTFSTSKQPSLHSADESHKAKFSKNSAAVGFNSGGFKPSPQENSYRPVPAPRRNAAGQTLLFKSQDADHFPNQQTSISEDQGRKSGEAGIVFGGPRLTGCEIPPETQAAGSSSRQLYLSPESDLYPVQPTLPDNSPSPIKKSKQSDEVYELEKRLSYDGLQSMASEVSCVSGTDRTGVSYLRGEARRDDAVHSHGKRNQADSELTQPCYRPEPTPSSSQSSQFTSQNLCAFQDQEKTERRLPQQSSVQAASRSPHTPEPRLGAPLPAGPRGKGPSMDAATKSATVVVKGPSVNQGREELVHLYFENKRSGGGEIVEQGIVWQEEQKCFLITFVDSDAAKRVASREHTLKECPLQVELWSPSRSSAEAVQKDRVRVTGLIPKITADCLQNYLECTLNVDVASVELSETGDSSLVIFESPEEDIDTQKMEQACQQVPLEDKVSLSFHRIHISEAGSSGTGASRPVSDTVRVAGLKPETATESVQYFFSNKRRNHGGPVESVSRTGDTTALVRFKDPADAESVVKKGDHTLDDHKLSVTHYEASDSGDRTHQRGAMLPQAAPHAFPSSGSSLEQARLRDQYQQPTAASVTHTQIPHSSHGGRDPGSQTSDFASAHMGSSQEREARGHTSYDPGFQPGPSPQQRISMANSPGFAGSEASRNPQLPTHMTSGGGAYRGPQVGFQGQPGPDSSALINSHNYLPKDKTNFEGNTSFPSRQRSPNTSETGQDFVRGSNGPPGPGFRPEVVNEQHTERKTSVQFGEEVIQKIIKDKTLLKKLVLELRSLECRFNWMHPDHIVIISRSENPGWRWEQDVVNAMEQFVLPIRLELQREREAARSSAERVAWRTGTRSGEQDMPSAVNTPSAATSDIQKPPSLGTMEDIIPNLRCGQMKILKLPKALEKLRIGYPGLEISLDEGKKTAVVRAPEDSMKRAFSDVLSFVTNLKETKIPLTPAVAEMFRKKDTEEWVQKALIEKYDLLCHWELCDDHIILNSQYSDSKRLEDMFKSAFKEVTCQLSEKEACVLKSPAWASFLERMGEMKKEGCPTPVFLAQEEQVIIVGTPSNTSETRLKLKDFLDENKLENEVLRVNPNQARFLQQHCKEETRLIQQNARDTGVSVTFTSNSITADGPKDSLAETVGAVRELVGKIKEDKMTFKKPGVASYLTGPKGQEFLSQTATTTGCYITTNNSGSGASGDGANSDSEEGRLLAKVNLDLNHQLLIVQGDITQCQVDAIVNAANTRLDHAGGVALAIAKAGGPSIQEESDEVVAKESLREGEVAVTGAGTLNCSHVLHAVGPIWSGGHQGEEELLTLTVKKTLKKAESMKLTSVAMPAISCGIFRYPVDKATLTIVKAIGAYFKEAGRSSCINKLILIDVGAEPLDGFMNAAKRVFGKLLVVKGGPKSSTRPGRHGGPETSTYRSDRDSASDHSHGGRSHGPVKIISGEIAKSRADVIVCTTHPSLDLKKGILSKSILEHGGEAIQQDLRKFLERNGPAELGKVVWTTGGNLDCKAVYHLSLPSWRDDRGKKMGQAVKECLDAASRKNARSIAFPTLGTGRLGYPPEQVASIMFSSIGEWFQTNPRSSMKEVQIIVFNRDTESLEAFKGAERQGGHSHRGDSYSGDRHSNSGRHGGDRRGGGRHGGGGGGGSGGGGGHRGGRHSESRHGGGSPDQLKTKMGKLTVMVKEGNILTEPCDAIVNSSNDNLDLSYGVLSKEISKACGPDLAAECRAQRDRMMERGVAITKVESSKLSCGNVVHVSADRFKRDWQKGVLEVLKAADEERITSISMPALGSGGRGADPTALADAMQQAVSAFSDRARNLREVRVVVFQKQMLGPYIAAFDPGAATGGMEEGSDGSGASEGDHGGKKKESGVDVFIVSMEKAAIEAAREKIYRHVKHVCTSHTETNPILATLSPRQIEELYKLQNKHDVEIVVDKSKSSVTVKGVEINVAKAVSNMKDVMYAAATERHLAAGGPPVRWQYEASKDKFVDFEPEQVLLIEGAFKKKEKEVYFSDKRRRKYKIVFKDRKEYPVDHSGHPVAVKRRDILEEKKQEIPLPTHWAPMKGEKVKRVELKPDSGEYKKVAAHFGGQAQVKKIERIQNPSLFQQFKVKKKELEQNNPKGTENEKRLFHGTPSDSVDGIITNGFNRSYCGRHGTALGNGVYFAADSATSMGFAQGGHMFQARVLVGEYTPGNSSMRMAPNKPNSNRPYDSVSNAPQNATVFVIFHDSQAYPEYLISF
ncbi:protein mono-ADP-ribosyltransferase PARP14-like isoform X2 [Babylonia areolata]